MDKKVRPASERRSLKLGVVREGELYKDSISLEGAPTSRSC